MAIKMKTITCDCGNTKEVRLADYKRGWGRSCSKACAAKRRGQRQQSGSHTSAKASKLYSKRYDNRRDRKGAIVLHDKSDEVIEKGMDFLSEFGH